MGVAPRQAAHLRRAKNIEEKCQKKSETTLPSVFQKSKRPRLPQAEGGKKSTLPEKISIKKRGQHAGQGKRSSIPQREERDNHREEHRELKG